MKSSLAHKSGTQSWWPCSSRTPKRVRFHVNTPVTAEKDTRHPQQRRNQRDKRCERCGPSILGAECKCGTRLRVRSIQDKERASVEAKHRAELNAADVRVQNREFWNEELKYQERERRQRKEENRWREGDERARLERQQRSQARQSQYIKHHVDGKEQERQRTREETSHRRHQQAREQVGSHSQRARKEPVGSSHHAHDCPSSRQRGRASVDYYALLGISRGATQAEVLKAAKKKRIETHPDRHSGQYISPLMFDAMVERAMLVGQAADVLGDSSKRLKYDQRPAAHW